MNDYCTHCATQFQHPLYNPPLIHCPNCGAPGTFFQNYLNQVVKVPGTSNPFRSNAAAGGVPAASNPHAILEIPIPTIELRCPGGCGSEIKVPDVQLLQAEAKFVPSPCKYSCKVRIELWNKKIEEAKKR